MIHVELQSVGLPQNWSGGPISDDGLRAKFEGDRRAASLSWPLRPSVAQTLRWA
jgi:hypothetical protein